ncbi:MAG: glycosyltransferase involved in cell wall biosynthesis, partial [Candidatus Paceibacteria bacterium]
MTTAKTILFLHPSAELYGADRTLLQLVEGLDAERWKAVVLLPRRGVLAGQLERLGALIEVGELGLGERASLDLSGILKLAYRVPLGALRVWRSIRRHRPSVVHTNTMVVLGGAIGARLSGVPHLWHVHEILEQPLWLARVYARLFSALAERVICNSEATRESFCRFSTHLTRNSDVVMNAVAAAPDLSDDVREATRKRLGLSPGQSLVLLAGRVNSWKGQTLLVQAAAQLRQRFPDTKYLIVGSAPAGQEHFEEALDEQIEQLGMESQVIRMAFCPDLSEI